MTKIMTTIIAFDLLKQNKLSLDDKFIVSEKLGVFLKPVIPLCSS